MSQLVSVIMPAYQSEAFLLQAMASVLGQTHRELELILVNDGSRDKTLELAWSVKDPRVRVIDQPNQGPAGARNRGLDLAQGDWVAFLDADDLWLPQKLELQLAAAAGREVMVYSDYKMFRGELESTPKAFSFCPWFERQGNLYRQLIQHNFIGTLTVLLPKSVVDRVGRFNPELFGPEDWDYWIRVAKEVPLVYLDQPLALYRQHEAGISKDYQRYEQSLQKVYDAYLLAQGTPEEINFGLWLFYRHMAHGFARQKAGGKALRLWGQAVARRPWVKENILSLGYVLLKGFAP